MSFFVFFCFYFSFGTVCNHIGEEGSTLSIFRGRGLILLTWILVWLCERRMLTNFFFSPISFETNVESIPDITPMLRPTTLGDVAAYTLFSAGGLFLGGELGLLTGSYAGMRSITQDPESRARIEKAFRSFRADLLRKEADMLDGGGSVLDKILQ